MPDSSVEARIARLEDRFADFLATMAEFKGSLTADMHESQRQRSGLFRMVEQVSHQLVEISTKFDAHVDAEEVLRIEFITRISRVEERVSTLDDKADELEERTGQPCVAHATAVCAPAPQPEPQPKKAPWYIGVASGGGLLTVIFGENIVDGIANVVRAVRNALH